MATLLILPVAAVAVTDAIITAGTLGTVAAAEATAAVGGAAWVTAGIGFVALGDSTIELPGDIQTINNFELV